MGESDSSSLIELYQMLAEQRTSEQRFESRVQHVRGLNAGIDRGPGSHGSQIRPGRRSGRDRHVRQAKRGTGAGTDEERGPSTTRTSDTPSPAAEGEGEICFVCVETIENYSFGPCKHPVCSNCSHRMRALYKKNGCVFCNTEMEEVVVMRADNLSYDEARTRAKFVDEAVGMRFESDQLRRRYQRMRSPTCGICDKELGSMANLKRHVRTEHKKTLCDVCALEKVVYPCELELYDDAEGKGRSDQLKKHMQTHPYCQFCKRHVLDADALFVHLQREHESCFICHRNGKMYEYFRDYANLEKHYRSEHFLCEEPQCRGVVFANNADLRVHQVRTHSAQPGSVRMTLSEFQGTTPAIPSARNQGARPNTHTQRNVERRNFEADLVVFSGGGDRRQDRNRAEGGGSGQTNESQGSRSRRTRTTTFQRDAESSNGVTLEPPRQAGNSSVPTRNEMLVMPARPTSSEEEKRRNQAVLRKLREVLDVADFDRFMEASGAFAAGTASAEQYFEDASNILRVDARKLLPELASLLRDEAQRRELSRVVQGEYRLLAAPEPSAAPTEEQAERAQEENFPALSGEGGRPPPVRFTRTRQQAATPSLEEAFPSLTPAREPANGSTIETKKNPGRQRQESRSEDFPSLGGKRQDAKKPNGSSGTSQSNNFPSLGSKSQDVDNARAGEGSSRSEDFPSLGGKSQDVKSVRDGEGSSSGTSLLGRQEDSRRSTSTPSSNAQNQAPTRETREDLFPAFESTTVPNSDPSMRVGAVWGGHARRVHERSNENAKAALARAAGDRATAKPLPAAKERHSDFPALTATQPLTTDHAQRYEGHSAGAASSSNPTVGVTDLAEIMRSRREQVAKSAVPKIGKNGFAWDKKKNAMRKQKAKEELAAREGRRHAYQ